MKKLSCFFGFHEWLFSSTYLPSIEAPVVTDFITHVECMHCKKVLRHDHWVWDGSDMASASAERMEEVAEK